MEPPSSDAEALRDQETAQVRASNGLLVAADELRHFECGHQPVRQPVVRSRCIRRRCVVSAVCADSVYVVFVIGTLRTCGVECVVRRLVLGLTNRVGMVRREDDRPQAIGSRGELGKAGFRTQRSMHARIVTGRESDAWRMCATHRTPGWPCRASSRNEKALAAG
jgi:hypothetical protein